MDRERYRRAYQQFMDVAPALIDVKKEMSPRRLPTDIAAAVRRYLRDKRRKQTAREGGSGGE